MPNFQSISFEMIELQRAGRICPPRLMCVLSKKTPCGIGFIVHIATTASLSGRRPEWITLGFVHNHLSSLGDSLKKLFSEAVL